MIEWWPEFLRPWWLIALPFALGIPWVLRYQHVRTGQWRKLLPPQFQKYLLTRHNKQPNNLVGRLLVSGYILSVLGLSGPAWQQNLTATVPQADPLIIVLELTPELYATDAAPNRLTQAKHKILDLLHIRQGAQTGIVVFAGSAHTLLPLSSDTATTQNLLAALKPTLMPVAGNRPDLGIQQAVQLLNQTRLGKGRIVLMASQVSKTASQSIQNMLHPTHTPLLVLGLGTPQGAPILSETGHFLRDDQGHTRISRLEQEALFQLAQATGGRYQQARLDDQDFKALGLQPNPQDTATPKANHNQQALHQQSWQDQGYWVLLPLLLIAACGARKGWLFSLPLVFTLLSPDSAQAFEWSDLWQRPEQKGWALLETQPAEAVKYFKNPQWQGIAHYKAGNYAEAIRCFSQSNSAIAHYNRGNALALSQQPEAAIAAYEHALSLQPELQMARQNKALVEHWMQTQQEEKTDAETQPPQNPLVTQQAEEAATSAASDPSQNPSPSNPELGSNEQKSVTPSPPAQTQSHTAAQLAATVSQGLSGEGASEATPEHPAEPIAHTQGSYSQQALDTWLRRIPDDPAELLRRKFLYEYYQSQEESSGSNPLP